MMNRGARELLRDIARERSRRDERGVVAIFVILCLSSFMFAAAAIGVDVARWHLEAQRVQRVADAAALGSVTYLPQDMASAKSTAVTISDRNGYPDSGTSKVVVAQAARPSQIRVTVCNQISNTFGGFLGIASTNICRTAVADYTGPAPMGSPCNTFGNEPSAGGGTKAQTPTGTALNSPPFPNCNSKPQFWANIAGPETDKSNGDRYQAATCSSSSVDGCDSAKKNTEYDPEGYFWLVRVQPAAVGSTVNLQLYDPAYVNTTTNCSSLPAATALTDAANDYVTDGKARYSKTVANSSTGAPYCSGDNNPASITNLMTTSFALRQQTDTLDPRQAPVQTDTSGSMCVKQYTGQKTAPVASDLNKTSGSYDDQLASEFHNWVSLCKFVPSRAGDYYIQVRTNVSTTGGTALPVTNGNAAMIFTGNANVFAATGNQTTGAGNNAFGIRAVTTAGLQQSVAVSGYDRMPIFANADSATSTFNLIRVTPGGAGKSISFSYFDVGDATGSGGGTVRVIPPSDATGTITTTPFPNGGCRATGGKAGVGPTTLTSCTAPFDASNNTHTETISIPIPNDYTCTYSSPGGCWYQVEVKFNGGSNVTDVTTWTASISGDPVRLIE